MYLYTTHKNSFIWSRVYRHISLKGFMSYKFMWLKWRGGRGGIKFICILYYNKIFSKTFLKGDNYITTKKVHMCIYTATIIFKSLFLYNKYNPKNSWFGKIYIFINAKIITLQLQTFFIIMNSIRPKIFIIWNYCKYLYIPSVMKIPINFYLI